MPSYFGSYARRGSTSGASSSEASIGRGSGCGIGVAVSVAMPDPPEPQETQPTERVHQFTVSRGMTPVLVIETTSWYLGLVQAALARVALEGQN